MTKVYQTLLLLSAITLLSSCCWIKARFTDEEMMWLNVYNVGDTLIFMSQYGDFDTTFIIDKRIRHMDCNPFLSYEGFNRPILGDVYYGRTPDEKPSTIKSLLGLIKNKSETSIYISYLYGSTLFIDMQDENFFKFKEGKVYKFDTSHPTAKPGYIKVLYWHEDYGIIKYITHEGIEWKRINLNFEVE